MIERTDALQIFVFISLCRLKRMMEEEMFAYTQEMKDEFEKRQESKIDDMRERVRALKEKRETEERKLVEKKLDQAFQ
jgi:hypothetical protein